MCAQTHEAMVYVVDDDPAMRHSLKQLVESVNLHAETYESAQDFLDAYDRSATGCLVLDVRMPGMSGLDLQERFAELQVTLPVIIISAHGDIPMAVRAVKNGAIDFIEKPFRAQVLLDRIHQALEQDRMNRRLRAETENFGGRMASLTPREREVMRLLIDGKAPKEIAAELGLSPKTVQVHRGHILEKTQVDSLAELVRLALRTGELN